MSDVSYALRSNFLYIEQKDLREVGARLSTPQQRTARHHGRSGRGRDGHPGWWTHGRSYDKEIDAPAFINLSAEPSRASLDLQTRLKQDIRELVKLAFSALAVDLGRVQGDGQSGP